MATASLPQEKVSPGVLYRAAAKKGELTILDMFDRLPWYKGAADWTAWRAFLCAVYGLPMSQREHDIFKRCTGRQDPPRRKVREAWVPVGRRGRKSAIMATIGVWEGAFREHSGYLAPGERARIPVIAKDKDDAGAIHGFAVAILSEPSLRCLLEAEPTAENIALENRCDIRTRAARITAGRSRAIVCALYDEIAFWPKDESATPDEEIIRGVEPGMANVPDALTAAMSSPYARKGMLWTKYNEYYGVESDEILIWEADTRTMHDTPAIRTYVEKAWRDDPVAAKAEVGDNGHVSFREDVESFVSEDVVDAAIVKGRHEILPNRDRPKRFFAFCDPSGGSQDSLTLGIAYHDEGKLILAYLREWRAPFKPKEVVSEAADDLKRYQIGIVRGDAYGGNWPRDRFSDHEIKYVKSKRTKGDIYRDILPRLNGGDVELLDDQRLRAQLVGLDRRTARGGRDSIDHAPGSHDDVANAACGALLEADVIGTRRKHPEREPDPPKTTWDVLAQQRQESLEEERRATEPKQGIRGRMAVYRRPRR